MLKIKTLLLLMAAIAITGCTRGHHGTFIASTYRDSMNSDTIIAGELIGDAIGESSQTFLFYIFPIGEAASTSAAIMDARSRYPDTRYLADVSIDDRLYWGVGYSKQIIRVEAKAYR